MAVYGRLQDILRQDIFDGRIASALRYLSGLDYEFFSHKRKGYLERVEIHGRYMYAMHQIYKTRPVTEALFEIHRAYIDVQYIWSGQEVIYCAPAAGLDCVSSYDKKKDIKFFKFTGGAAALIMKPGMAAVFFPEDAHAPALSYARPRLVSKTVVKVRNR